MPNATVRANAPAMPMNRRAALGAIAASALLAASGVAAASNLDPDVAAAVERVTAASRAEREVGARLTEIEATRNGAALDQAQEAYDAAAAALGDAQEALLEAKPRTLAGVRAMLATLLDTDALSDWPVADTLARALLDAPALGGEA